MAKDIVKPAFSFDGYSLYQWVLGNGKTIKELVKVLVPALIAWVSTSNPAYTAIATVFGKWILDGLEYYIKER
jgi:hypothetical protein